MKRRMIASGIVCSLFLVSGFPLIYFFPPFPVYYIRNYDSVNHTVSIAINNEFNLTILSKTYDVAPDERIRFDRYIIHQISPPFITYNFPNGEYTITVILDDNISMSRTQSMSRGVSFDISLHHPTKYIKDFEPLKIRVLCGT